MKRLLYTTLIVTILLLAASKGIAEVNFDKGDISINTAEGSVDISVYPMCDNDNNIYFVWLDLRNGSDDRSADIYFRKYNIKTEIWSDEVRINTGVAGEESCILWSFCTDKNGNIYILWDSSSNGPFLFKYSHDFGATWSDEQQLYSGESITSKITCDNKGNVYLVWSDADNNSQIVNTYFIKSSDKGQTWDTSPILIQSVPYIPNYIPGYPFDTWPTFVRFFSNNSGNLYLLWLQHDGTKYDLYVRSSVDFGESWNATAVKISNGSIGVLPGYILYECNDLGNAYVVWQVEQNGKKDIFLNATDDGGLSWLDADVRIDTDELWEHDSQFPKLSCDNIGNVYVAWLDEREKSAEPLGDSLFFNSSYDFGKTWGDDRRIDKDLPNGFVSGVMDILNDDAGNLYAIWRDIRNSNDANYADIYMNYSHDFGENWQPVDLMVNNTSPAGIPYRFTSSPCASDKGDVFITWSQGDFRDYWNRTFDGFFTYCSNAKPIANIEDISPNPADYGENIQFSGSGIDEDGDIIAYNWRSNLEGCLSAEQVFERSDLSIGVHNIYFKVRDDNGIWSSETHQELIIEEQAKKGVLYGKVIGREQPRWKKPKWVPLKNATVEVRCRKNGITETIETDENGNYRIENLPRGMYRIKVSKDGYRPRHKRRFLKKNREKRVNFRLFKTHFRW